MASSGTEPPLGHDTFHLRLVAHLPMGGATGNSVRGGPARGSLRVEEEWGQPWAVSGPRPRGDGGKEPSQCASSSRPHGHPQANSHAP